MPPRPPISFRPSSSRGLIGHPGTEYTFGLVLMLIVLVAARVGGVAGQPQQRAGLDVPDHPGHATGRVDIGHGHARAIPGSRRRADGPAGRRIHRLAATVRRRPGERTQLPRPTRARQQDIRMATARHRVRAGSDASAPRAARADAAPSAGQPGWGFMLAASLVVAASGLSLAVTHQLYSAELSVAGPAGGVYHGFYPRELAPSPTRCGRADLPGPARRAVAAGERPGGVQLPAGHDVQPAVGARPPGAHRRRHPRPRRDHPPPAPAWA